MHVVKLTKFLLTKLSGVQVQRIFYPTKITRYTVHTLKQPHSLTFKDLSVLKGHKSVSKSLNRSVPVLHTLRDVLVDTSEPSSYALVYLLPLQVRSAVVNCCQGFQNGNILFIHPIQYMGRGRRTFLLLYIIMYYCMVVHVLLHGSTCTTAW